MLDHDFPKLAAIAGEAPVIRDNPPLIYHLKGKHAKDLESRALDAFLGYRESLSDDRRVLLDRYDIRDFAMKVVGVGSVGTFCAVALLMASEKDPLFLQIKEARPSVLEAYAGKSLYPSMGSGSSPGIASSRRRATFSLAGRRGNSAGTTTCASSGT